MHWMAPEVLRGEAYSEDADVYSFGVIVWEMLTGEIPYMGRSLAQIAGSVGFHGCDQLQLLPPEDIRDASYLYKHLRKVVNNCLRFDPQERPKFEHITKKLSKMERRE